VTPSRIEAGRIAAAVSQTSAIRLNEVGSRSLGALACALVGAASASCGPPPGAPAGSSEYTPDRTYLVVFCAGIAGDLGSFGGADLHVTTEGARTTTIVAGPVPETTPTLPTTVTLHFADGLLTTVEARTPSGATYSFRATRSSGGGI
jgi:hypothetical protein